MDPIVICEVPNDRDVDNDIEEKFHDGYGPKALCEI